MRADFFGSLPRFIRKGFDFRDARGAVQRMVLHFIAAGRLSADSGGAGAFVPQVPLGGGEPAGRVPVFLSFRTRFPEQPATIRRGFGSVCCLPLRPMAGPTSFFSVYRTFCWMRRSPLRARGVLPNRRRNSSSLIASHSRSEIVSGSNRGSNAASGAWGFLVVGTAWAAIAAEDPSVEVGQGAGLFSIVRQEMQRFVSITLGATMAPVGQLSRQFRQRPQRAPANGASYWSDGRVAPTRPAGHRNRIGA